MKTHSADAAKAPAPTGNPASSEAINATLQFPPRTDGALDGLLIVAHRSKVDSNLSAMALPALTNLVHIATNWPSDDKEPDGRIGDFRFLILEFTQPGGVTCYVQIRSQPANELKMEVIGPGDRNDPARNALTERIAPPLYGRGFAIGGGADNFCKQLAVPTQDAAPQIAAEMLSLIIDVLGYDGSMDLHYKLHQSSYLRAAYVTFGGMAREGLYELLRAWGLSAVMREDKPTVLDAHSHGFDFWLELHVPVKGKTRTYWEIHVCAVVLALQERVKDLLHEVNDSPVLMKASPGGTRSTDMIPVLLATGISLSGGVPFLHIKGRVFEWLESVKAIRLKYCAPPPSAPIANASAAQKTKH